MITKEEIHSKLLTAPGEDYIEDRDILNAMQEYAEEFLRAFLDSWEYTSMGPATEAIARFKTRVELKIKA